MINPNWRLNRDGVTNREIQSNPDLVRSTQLNFDVKPNGLDWLDLKIDDSDFAAIMFTQELLFVKMNGNFTEPRLLGYIENEKSSQRGIFPKPFRS